MKDKSVGIADVQDGERVGMDAAARVQVSLSEAVNRATEIMGKAAHRIDELHRLYNELLYAVERKHPGETRHETALRYIRQAEAVSVESGKPQENVEAK